MRSSHHLLADLDHSHPPLHPGPEPGREPALTHIVQHRAWPGLLVLPPHNVRPAAPRPLFQLLGRGCTEGIACGQNHLQATAKRAMLFSGEERDGAEQGLASTGC